MPDILAIGEPLGEFNQTRQGEPNFLFGHGGDTSNAIIAAARAGASTAYFSALGDDTFGRSFLDLWAKEGVDSRAVKIERGGFTGIYFVTHGAEGHEFSFMRAGSAASKLGPADLPLDLIRSSKVLHVSGISQAISGSAADMIFAAMAEARAAGVTVSYDSNLRLRLWPIARARAIINTAMRQCDIALPGLDDARHLTGLSDPDAICDFYLEGGAKIVAMTLGKEGAIVAIPAERRRIPSIVVNAVDATGAGDCFDGAFLTEWVKGGDPFAAARFACVAAALSTQGYGAVAPLPMREAVLARLTAEG